MRWLKVFLIGIAAVLAAVLLAVTWYLSDTDRVKKDLEELVSTATGRPLSINGELHFSIAPTITVSVREVEWRNPGWSSTPFMLHIEQADVGVDLWSLVRPPVILREVNVAGAVVELEWTEAGQFNWEFENLRSTGEAEDEGTGPLDLILVEAELQDIALRIQSPVLTQPLVINTLAAEQKRDDTDMLVLAVDTTVDDNDATITGNIGPFSNLLAARDFDFELKVEGAFVQLMLDGRVGELPDLDNSNLALELHASDIGRTLENLKLPRVTAGEAALSGTFSVLPGDISAELAGAIGEFELDATLGLKEFAGLRGLALSVNSAGPSAKAAGAIGGFTALPATPYTLQAQADDTSDGIRISELAFVTQGVNLNGSGLLRNYPELNDADFTLHLDAEKADLFAELIPALTIPAVPLTAELSVLGNGVNIADSLEGGIKLGQLQINFSGTLAENTNFAGSKIDFGIEAPDSELVAGMLKLGLTRSVPVSIQGSALVRGDSIELADTQLKVEDNNATITGSVPFEDPASATSLSVQIEGPNAAMLVGLFADPRFVPPLEYSFGGDVGIGDTVRLSKWRGTLGGTSLEVDGGIDPATEVPAIDLSISASGDNFSESLATLELEDVPTGAFNLTTQLRVSADGIVASNIRLAGTGRSVSGQIRSAWPDEPEQITFDLVATGLDLSGSVLDIGPYEPARVPFDIRLKGEIDDDHVYIDQAKLKLGGSNVEIAGRIETAPMIAVENLQVSGSGEKLSDLGGTEEWHFGEIPFRITTAVSGSENQVEVKELRFTAGESDLEGNLRIDSREKPNYEIQLRSKFLDLASIVVDETTEEEMIEAEEEPGADPDVRLIPDIPVPYDTLRSFDATLDVDIERLVASGVVLSTFRLDGTLKDGRVDIYDISGRSNKGDIRASIRLEPTESKSYLESAIKGTGVILEVPGFGAPEGEESPGFNVDMKITADGNDLREIAANMNGYLWLQGGARKVENLGIAGIFGDTFTALFDKINPFTKKDPYTNIECIGIFFEAEDGILETSPAVVMLTDKILTDVRGTVDLSTEELSFDISTSARKGIGLSAGDLVNPFIKVSGTLSSPGVAAGAPGVLEGGVAVATGGVSLLYTGVFKRFFGARDPCGKASENALEIRRERDPANVPVPAE
ncbi:MAG: AsmA family protein [Gammaproteobacteria bacterium]|nr:AsmA family protein [Gammaproteobacteria bacterium]MDP6616163.1 AsmA family protein [Gammaproteobacteria bacterium]MDP6695629.1 AsmA family protein [Gammaproteobacteria bacterium]